MATFDGTLSVDGPPGINLLDVSIVYINLQLNNQCCCSCDQALCTYLGLTPHACCEGGHMTHLQWLVCLLSCEYTTVPKSVSIINLQVLSMKQLTQIRLVLALFAFITLQWRCAGMQRGEWEAHCWCDSPILMCLQAQVYPHLSLPPHLIGGKVKVLLTSLDFTPPSTSHPTCLGWMEG